MFLLRKQTSELQLDVLFSAVFHRNARTCVFNFVSFICTDSLSYRKLIVDRTAHSQEDLDVVFIAN